VIRSDAGKLTACREVAGFYKPCLAKSRLNDMAKAPLLQPFLALALSVGQGICGFARESFATDRIPRSDRRPIAHTDAARARRIPHERLTNRVHQKNLFVYQQLTRIATKLPVERHFSTSMVSS
jgi:hypothetical protein